MTEDRRCLVVGSDPAIAATVAAVVDATSGLVTSGVLEPSAALSGIWPASDAIVACDGPGQPAIDLAPALVRACGDLPVVLVTRDADVAAYRAALKVGARGLLGLPPTPDLLREAVVGAAAGGAGGTGRAAVGRVVAVCGAKGGCGTSSVSLELAVGGSGVLVDMAGGFDDAAARLGCSPHRSLSDIAGLDDALGADALRSVMAVHPSGLRLVARPGDPAAQEMLSPGLGRALVRGCRAVDRLAVVDLGLATGQTGAAVAVGSDRTLLVTAADRGSVECAVRAAAWLDRMGVPGTSVGLVVNRWSRSGELSLRGIERAVGVPIAAAVRDGELRGLSNAGRRVSPLSQLAREMVAA